MGLLSKAISGYEAPSSQGGLLRLLSQKTSGGESNELGGFTREEPDDVSLPLEKAVMEKLSGSYTKFGVFSGLIIETNNSFNGELTDRLAFMISGFGTVQGLPHERCLVLFDSSEDNGLIGQHLAKTVPGTIIFSFEAKDTKEAFVLIKPYL